MGYQTSEQISELLFNKFTIGTSYVRSNSSGRNYEARRVKLELSSTVVSYDIRAQIKGRQALLNEASILQELVGDSRFQRLIEIHKENNEIMIVLESVHLPRLELGAPIPYKTLDVYYTVTSRCKRLNDPKDSTQRVKKAVLPIMLHVMRAVEFLHSQRISHRNLNLHSVLVGPDTDSIKISDFTLAVRLKTTPISTSIRKDEDFMTDIEDMLHVLRSWSRDTQLMRKEPYLPDMLDSWQIGILFYYLIVGDFPMMPRRRREDFMDIQLPMMEKLSFQLPKIAFDVGIGQLLRGLFNPNARERISVIHAVENLEYILSKEKSSRKALGHGTDDQVVPMPVFINSVPQVNEKTLNLQWKRKLEGPVREEAKSEKYSRYTSTTSASHLHRQPMSLQDRRKAPVSNLRIRR